MSNCKAALPSVILTDWCLALMNAALTLFPSAAMLLYEFQQKYIPEHLEEVGYIKAMWLVPFKEKLICTWVDQVNSFWQYSYLASRGHSHTP